MSPVQRTGWLDQGVCLVGLALRVNAQIIMRARVQQLVPYIADKRSDQASAKTLQINRMTQTKQSSVKPLQVKCNAYLVGYQSFGGTDMCNILQLVAMGKVCQSTAG